MQIKKHSRLESFFTEGNKHHDAQEFLTKLLTCFCTEKSTHREEIYKIFGVTVNLKCEVCELFLEEQKCININLCDMNVEQLASEYISDINVSCQCGVTLKVSIIKPPSVLVKTSFS